MGKITDFLSKLCRLVKKAAGVARTEGIEVAFYKVKYAQGVRNIYKRWIAGNERGLLHTEELEYTPFFSVVIPVYNVADRMLKECIDSVLAQTYRRFEIVLVDDASTQESVRTVLAEYEPLENVKVIYRKENGHISKATNDGISASSGEFVALCDCDDLYAPNALYEIAAKLNEDRTLDFIYSDEDKISEDGKVRRDPFFKPDWSPETFMSYMYTCHLAVYRKSLLEEIGGLRVGFEGSQDYDLVLRIMEKTSRIGHVPKILYHWRMRAESTANAMTAKPYVMESTRRAKEEALMRRKIPGTLTLIPDIAQYRVTYIPRENPLISIIIPSKDNVEVLARGLKSIREKTAYANYEMIVVDNGSTAENKEKVGRLADELDVRYLYDPMPFHFSKMCNIGANAAKGGLLLFLNDDIEITEEVKKNPHMISEVGDWLSILAGQAQVSYTGAVGCKLYYPGTIRLQHAGVLNLKIGPGHCLYGQQDNLNYYYGRNLLDYNFTAVTGACLMIEKKKFEEVGGFDENFPVAYNDVELCFKLVEHGYYNVLRNDVALVHHESVSRGRDDASAKKEERRKKEMEKLYEMHPLFAGGYDPCYNPNLVKDKGDFSFDMSNAVPPCALEKLTDRKLQRIAKLEREAGVIRTNIEQIVETEETVRVSGWAYDAEKKNNNHNKTFLILKNETAAYQAPCRTVYRNDVVRVGKNGVSARGLALTGFEVVFLKEQLEAGRYEVGIAVGKQYTMCGSFVDIGS